MGRSFELHTKLGKFGSICTFQAIDGCYCLWQYELSSFQAGGIKLERFLPKNQRTERKFLNFENWTNGSLSSLQKSEFLKLIILIFHVKKLNN